VTVARWTTVVGAMLALVVVAAMALTTWHSDTPGRTVLAPVPGTSTPAGTARPGPTATPGVPERREPTPPIGVRIPALDVRAPVVAVGLDDSGALVPPPDPRVVGWWSGGTRPGTQRGAAVLAGHTVHDGGGVFDDLAGLAAGDTITVVTRGEDLTFVVRRVRDVGKERLAATAGRLFSQAGASRLVLVTCTDWDGTRYLGNTVVVARAR
jgi:LPXTG-site transpeptidase (sortase) family protein